MIQNLDHKSKKTRKNLRYTLLKKSTVENTIKNDPKAIFWSYDPETDLYTKVTATIENGKVILKDQKHNVVDTMEKEYSDSKKALFYDKKVMLAYQRAPETKIFKKKDLLREALGTADLIEMAKANKPVWGFQEDSQTYQQYNVTIDNNKPVLKDLSNKIETFIDAIFKTEKEVKTYQDATFM